MTSARSLFCYEFRPKTVLQVWNTGLGPRRVVRELDPGTFAKDAWGHLVVDDRMRVLRATAVAAGVAAKVVAPAQGAAAVGSAPIDALPNIFAIGDAAAVAGRGYASTAQVAEQQGLFMGHALVAGAQALAAASVGPGANGRPCALSDAMPTTPFVYRHRGAFVYLGTLRAAADFTKAEGARNSLLAPLYGRALGGAQAFLLYRSAYLTQLGSWRNRLQVPVDWMRTWLFGRDTTQF